jgi:cation transport regulator
MPITAAKAPKVLPKHAKEIFAAAFNSAYDGTCKGDDACSSKIAWSAVKSKYQKDEKGSWQPKSDIPELSEFSLYISKASFDKKSGEMRWTAVASDTDEDLTEEFMSLELFQDFIQRAESGEEVPEEFRSSYWTGGMPYVSVSHYPDCDGKTSAGICQALYVDGNRLKAKGLFADNELGRACFKSVCESLYKDPAIEKKVRISIGFLDWKHIHGDTQTFERKSMDDFCMSCLMTAMGVSVGKKRYLKGQLIHLALTREPANPRTDITDQMEVIKSMTTQKSDAASIVGDELAEKIEEESKKLVGKSLAFVTKAEEPDLSEQVDEEPEKVEDAPVVETDKSIDEPVSEIVPEVIPEVPVVEDKFDVLSAKLDKFLAKSEEVPHPLDEAISRLKAAFDTVSVDKSLDKDKKLMVMQESFEGLGQVLRTSFGEETQPEAGTSTPNSTEVNVETLKTAFQEAIQPLAESVKLLLQYSSTPTVEQVSRQDKPPVRRSIVMPAFTGEVTPEAKGPTPKLREIVNRSVYGSR